jgi:hypothetical protein
MAKHKDERVEPVTRLKAWPKEIVSRQAPPTPESPVVDDEDDGDDRPIDDDPKPNERATPKRGARKK